MGLDARCEVRWQGDVWNAAVHLDSTALEVRGRPRLVLPLKQIRGVHPGGAELSLDTEDGRLTLVLGGATAAWARKILAPPSRLAKLGVIAEQRVSMIGLEDAGFRAELEAAGARLVARGKVDSVFFGVAAAAELQRLAELRDRVEPAGAVWVVRVKGKAASVKEGDVREAARAVGLVDVKVAAFSETHTADKLVIPVAARSRPAAANARTDPPRGRATKVGPRQKKKKLRAGRVTAGE
jgi:hypothetical protein